MEPNAIGYVLAYEEERSDKGEPKVRLKLRLKNTLGKEREIWVEGPLDLAPFFAE